MLIKTRMNMKKIILFVIFGFLSSLAQPVYAKELKIAFTGQAYSMLYPCACPSDPEGGMSRRAAVIKQLRSGFRDTILVEAGNSFATGQWDQYSQNSEIDRSRTEFYLEAIRSMDYDALLISSQEYVFGPDFLSGYKDLPFISSNMEGTQNGYIIKDLGWIKVGILGLTDSLAGNKGASGWQLPAVVLQDKIDALKKKGARVVILLSALSPEEDKQLLAKIKGVDVVINGYRSYTSVVWNDAGNVIYLTTWWQSRKVGLLTLDVTGRKISKRNLETLSLGSNASEDASVKELLPECFQAQDCKKTPGLAANCAGQSTKEARCVYTVPKKVSLTVIVPKQCGSCRTDEVIRSLRSTILEMSVDIINDTDPKARAFIKDFGLTMLPAYIFDKRIEDSEHFNRLSQILTVSKDSYLLKSEYSGVSYILGRKEILGRLDVFFGFDGTSTPEFFQLLKNFQAKHRDIDIRLHLLAVEDKTRKGRFLARRGDLPELEELSRIACINTLYHDQVFDYLICRAKNKESSWWDQCLAPGKTDLSKIRACAISGQGKKAMAGHTELTQELKIASGPTFIINNNEILGMAQVPSLAEFERAVLLATNGTNSRRGSNENTERK